MKARVLLSLVIALVGAGVGSAQFYGKYESMPTMGQQRTFSVNGNSEVRVEQKLNTIIPGDIELTNSKGVKVMSDEIFDDRPTLLLMVFYQCSGVCTIELNNLITTLRGLKKDNSGELYNVVVVSIDPSETYQLAAQKREMYVDMYMYDQEEKRKGAEKGWSFLVGDEKNIDRLADAVGFYFVRDGETGNITHPAALMVVSPERRMTRYFVSQEFNARPVLLALKDAAADKVGERDIFTSLISCVNVDPLTGRRSLNVMNLVRLVGLATMLGVGVSVFVMNRRSKVKKYMKRGKS